MTSPDKYAINWLQTWIEFKNKCTYFDYAFSRVPMRYPLDTSDQKGLNEYSEIQSDIEAVWIEAYPQMIMASDKKAMKEISEISVSKSISRNSEFRMHGRKPIPNTSRPRSRFSAERRNI